MQTFYVIICSFQYGTTKKNGMIAHTAGKIQKIRESVFGYVKIPKNYISIFKLKAIV